MMTTHNADPDVVRWGLHLLDGCTFSHGHSPGVITRYDPDLSQVEYVEEGFCQPSYVENDEAVARAYQEELSQLDSMDASGMSNFENKQVQSFVNAQDWLSSSSNGNYNFDHQHIGNESCQNSSIDESYDMKGVENCGPSEREHDVHEVEAFGPSSSSREIPVTGEDWWHSLEILDESSLDGEVGKRLNQNQMVPIPHVPKINEKMPSDDEEISDHQRLLDRIRILKERENDVDDVSSRAGKENGKKKRKTWKAAVLPNLFEYSRLQLYELIESKVQGDGNCQFRALSDQLYRSPDLHKFVREQIIQQLKSFPDVYAGYVPMAYSDYLKRMSKSGEWGDHVTLQAAADWYGVKIFVITSFKNTCYIEILPQIQKSGRVIFLSFWAEVHYNSIYPEGEMPSYYDYVKKKKRWWNFGG